MSITELRPAFRRRFRTVARQIRSLHVGQGLARTALVAAALLGAIAAADYFFELYWPIRAGLAAASAAVMVVLAVRWIVRPALAWNRTRVARELEGLFPRLGQRLRTAAQHGGRPDEDLVRDGMAPGLVAALEEETAEKTRPLPFQAALSVRPALVWTALGLCCVAVLAFAAAGDPEWQTALRRAALAPEPYTNLSASPSAAVVDEGGEVEVHAELSGRARPSLILHAREQGNPEWRQETMDEAESAFTARLSNLRATTEFFVSAGPERTPVQQVLVRHPLKLVGTRVEVTAPAYTGLAVATHDSGSFSALQGSTARIRFELDRPPAAATLVVTDPAKPKAPPRRIDMTLKDRHAWAEMPLAADVEYSVEARDAEHVPAAANHQRIRVTADQPPVVWFDSPAESLEVHTLAEVVMRARARDDFGLSKLGIVFQVNNEEERTLILNEPGLAPRSSPLIPHPAPLTPREALAEQVLMLEQFLLTQKDCVAYYAFAEDNRPDAPQRTTTELRFIDIRPFRRTYQLIDAPDAPPGSGPKRDLIFLDEVIARQRFNLNQTMRLETRSRARLDLAAVEQVAAFENKLATQTHELADFLAGLGVDGAAILAQAEEAMLSAVDSLQGAKFSTAINQERDALRFLMEARNTVQQALFKSSRKVRAQARAFDRLQRQKLRRPNNKAESLGQIAEELAKLAGEEDEVARTLAGQESKTAPKEGKEGDDPLQERQNDVAGRAAALDKTAANAKGLTELAKTRIADGAKAANAGADALGQRDRPTARKEVDRAREIFQVTAKQVAALAAEEAAQQIAAARDLANDVAMQTAPAEGMKNRGAGSGQDEKKMPPLGSAAEQAKSVKDVLEQVAASGSEGSAEAARKIGGLLKKEDLAAAIKRLEKPGAGKDRTERQDLADRFAALGQKLDQIYRETIAPRLEELARLEREANELERRAAAAEDSADWRRLRQQGAKFVDHLEAAGVGDLVNEDLRMGVRANTLPAGKTLFLRGIAAAHARLVAKLQDFVAGDRAHAGNEAVPQEYRDLVERYLRALSAGRTK